MHAHQPRFQEHVVTSGAQGLRGVCVWWAGVGGHAETLCGLLSLSMINANP